MQLYLYKNNLDFPQLKVGLRKLGMSDNEIKKIMGANWLRYFDNSFNPQNQN